MGEIHGYQLMVLEWTMIGVTLFCVGIRMYIRKYRVGLFFDWTDFFLAFAWLSFLAQGIMDTFLNKMGFFEEGVNIWEVASDVAQVKALKLYYVENITYLNCMYAVKCCMLCFFHGLISRSTMRKTYIAYWITTFVVYGSWLFEILITGFYCWPIERNWSLDDNKFCSSLDIDIVVGFTQFFHLATDIMIYCLPIPVIRTVMIPMRQKIGLLVAFGFGFFCIFFAAALLAVTYLSTSFGMMYSFCVMEQSWAVIVACVPAFKSLVAKESNRRRTYGASYGHGGTGHSFTRKSGHHGNFVQVTSRCGTSTSKTRTRREEDSIEEDVEMKIKAITEESTKNIVVQTSITVESTLKAPH